MAHRVLPETEVRLASEVPRDVLDHQEKLETKERKDPQATWDPKATLASQVQRGLLVLEDPSENQAYLGMMAVMAHPESMVRRGMPAGWVSQAKRDRTDFQGCLEKLE